MKMISRLFPKKNPIPVIDLTFLPPNTDKIRGFRDESRVNTVVTHVTAVRGGFGPGSSRMQKWQEELDQDTVDPSLLRQLKDFPPEDKAHLLALWERYSGLPYHWMAVPGIKSHVIHNLFPSVYSYHAGIGNKYSVGWALDCQYDEVLPDHLVEAAKVSLKRCIQEVRSACQGTVFVQAHRQHSSMRGNDPGPIVWSRVVVPVVEEIPYAQIRYDLSEGAGKPIPDSWTQLEEL